MAQPVNPKLTVKIVSAAKTGLTPLMVASFKRYQVHTCTWYLFRRRKQQESVTPTHIPLLTNLSFRLILDIMLGKWLAKLMGSKKEGKPRKSASAKKPPASPNLGKEIGRVAAYFRIPAVAVIRVREGNLRQGDHIWIRGHTTDLKQTITSLQINHQPIQAARKGDEVGVTVSSRARRGDRVYRITP